MFWNENRSKLSLKLLKWKLVEQGQSNHSPSPRGVINKGGEVNILWLSDTPIGIEGVMIDKKLASKINNVVL